MINYKNRCCKSEVSLELNDHGMVLTLNKVIGSGKLLNINTGSTLSPRLPKLLIYMVAGVSEYSAARP